MGLYRLYSNTTKSIHVLNNIDSESNTKRKWKIPRAWFQSICFILVSINGRGHDHIIHKAHTAEHMHTCKNRVFWMEFLRFCFHFLKLQRLLFSFFWQFFSHQNQKFFFSTQIDTFKNEHCHKFLVFLRHGQCHTKLEYNTDKKKLNEKTNHKWGKKKQNK